MASIQRGGVLRQVERLFGDGTVAGLSEGQLLERFLARGDEAAFAAIVARHGPMVLAVCRRVLNDAADAEDAFQATFLVLVRRGRAIRNRESLASWLHGVAHRVAARARLDAARRRRIEVRGAMDPSQSVAAAVPDDLAPAIHEELAALPEKYRAPVVLCYLEGLSHDEAARALGWPIGTVKGRLARARERLRGRLERRGIAAAGGALVAAISARGATSAVVPHELAEETIRAATLVAAGKAAAIGAFSARVATLAEGVIKAMILAQWKGILPVALVAAGVVATGVVAHAYQASGRPERRNNPVAGAKASDTEPAAADEKTGPDGGGLTSVEPADAPRDLRAERDRLALRAFKQALDTDELPDVDRLNAWSRRILDGEAARHGQGDLARREALRQHFGRMKDVEHAVRSWAAKHNEDAGLALTAAVYYRAEAELLLEEGRPGPGDASAPAPKAAAPRPAAPTEKPRDSATGLGSVDTKKGTPGAKGYLTGGRDPRSMAILDKLDDPIDMPFESETPLSEVIKYIKSATAKGPGEAAIPIYVDPLGLQEAEKTMESTVTLNLQGVPLRTTLRLMLSQLNLEYAVEDGVLIVSSPDQLAELRSRQGPQFEYEDYERRKKQERQEEERAVKSGGGGIGGKSFQ
ncbi:MAG TPA: sigma-70 family RNA polymerase sigma factor [Isosphaeraceae bacterium]|jgi:RNA polymerase sigma factor (sigma-70 family)|nr:sigma-70 family RNA polymerase sigma factor [Isosphaeraceae bacterium]